MREPLAQKYIRGRGIEIGGLHYPLAVPLGAKVTYVDRIPPEEAHPDVRDKVKIKNVIIDDAEILENFDTQSQDFIIANHVIEHCHDPLGTIYCWWEKLRAGGIIYAAVPEKTKTFDAPRAITTLAHIKEDFKKGLRNTDDVDHYREWFSLVDKVQDPELSKKVEHAVRERTNIHFHVWDIPAMKEFLAFVTEDPQIQLLEFVEHGAEVIWILRKPE